MDKSENNAFPVIQDDIPGSDSGTDIQESQIAQNQIIPDTMTENTIIYNYGLEDNYEQPLWVEILSQWQNLPYVKGASMQDVWFARLHLPVVLYLRAPMTVWNLLLPRKLDLSIFKIRFPIRERDFIDPPPVEYLRFLNEHRENVLNFTPLGIMRKGLVSLSYIELNRVVGDFKMFNMPEFVEFNRQIEEQLEPKGICPNLKERK